MADQQSSGDPQMLDVNNWLYFTFYWFKRSVFFDYYIWALLIHQWTINSSFIMANGLIIIHEMCLGLSKCSSSAPIINYSISKRWLINAELVIHLLVEKRIHLKFIGDELFIHCWLKGYLFIARWIIDYLCVFCARGPHLGLIYVHEDPCKETLQDADRVLVRIFKESQSIEWCDLPSLLFVYVFAFWFFEDYVIDLGHLLRFSIDSLMTNQSTFKWLSLTDPTSATNHQLELISVN